MSSAVGHNSNFLFACVLYSYMHCIPGMQKEGDPQICGFLRLVDLRFADPIRPNKPAAKIYVVFCHERAEKEIKLFKRGVSSSLSYGENLWICD